MPRLRTSEQILWVDDSEKFLLAHTRLLGLVGFAADGVTSGIQAVTKIEKNLYRYAAVFVDLDMPEMDGIELIRRIRRISKDIPIVIVSARTGPSETEWPQRVQGLMDELDEKIPVIPKPIPVAFEECLKSNDIEERIETYLQRLYYPFHLSFVQFLNLDEDEQDDVFDLAAEISEQFVKTFFEEHPKVDWIIIAHEPENIIDRGLRKDEPLANELAELAKSECTPVFLYSRPPVVECISTGWSQKTDDDYYPTILLALGDEVAECLLTCDFDTGSESSYADRKVVNDCLDLPRQALSTSWIRGNEKYQYSLIHLNCVVCDHNSQRKVVSFRCQIVKEWVGSPLTKYYTNRVALIGRNILLESDLKLCLDGRTARTSH